MTAYSIRECDEDTFLDAFVNTLAPLEDVRQFHTVRYLRQYLVDGLHAQSMVIEHNYTDRDYLEDHASYYVRAWRDFPRQCRRIHFFKTVVSDEVLRRALESGIDNPDEKALRADYLGFVVVRPLPGTLIGRTILGLYPEEKADRPEKRCYTVTREYDPHLFGIKLPIESLAFQEQDSVVAACATVALWSAFHKTSQLFEGTTPTPGRITELATRFGHRGRATPNTGLGLTQMAEAVRSVGLSPELTFLKDPLADNVVPWLPLIPLIYGYLRRGYPVVLIGTIGDGKDLHAITVTGYSIHPLIPGEALHRHRKRETASGQDFPSSGNRIDELYCHDDQLGPFAHFKVVTTVKDARGVKWPVALQGHWKGDDSPELFFPTAILTPIYHKIRRTYYEIYAYLRLMGRAVSAAVFAFLDPANMGHEWDIHLTTTNDWKKRIRQKGALTGEALRRVLEYPHPKYIWRCSLRQPGRPLVEFLADATSVRQEMPFYGVVWHDEEAQESFSKILLDRQGQPSAQLIWDQWVDERVPGSSSLKQSSLARFLQELASTSDRVALRSLEPGVEHFGLA